MSDAAGLLGVALHTVRALIERGDVRGESFVPTDRPRRRRVVRLRPEDVDDYLERARVKPGELAHLKNRPAEGRSRR